MKSFSNLSQKKERGGFDELPSLVLFLGQFLNFFFIILDCPILDAPIPLPTSAKILEKVLEYCKYHHANPDASVVEEKPEDQYRTDNISDWDKKFCEVPHATLFELIIAANFLDIKPLLDVTCKTVANMIKGKSPQDIRDTFGIKNDFTPEEEEQVRKENLWCEEH